MKAQPLFPYHSKKVFVSSQPTLRPLDFQPITYRGQQMWLLRDPLKLSETQLIFPPELAQILLFLDGSRSVAQIHLAFCQQVGEWVDVHLINETLAQLDAACLLDNERSRQAKAQILAAYRNQPYRPPALAGLGYPADPAGLDTAFHTYAENDLLNDWQPWHGQAIISPHIDYQRGGPVYAKVWRRAAATVAEADLVLIFGTDHNGGSSSLTLTRQPYATPYGLLPTDLNLVDGLAETIGPENSYALELNHREEHSIELSAVWLHHTLRQVGRAACPMVPILCGSFHHFVSNGHHPAGDPTLNAFIEKLRQLCSGRRVLAVASVDLAHVGPNFGDPFRMDKNRRDSLTLSDKSLIEAINRGDHLRFYQEIAAGQDSNRICGFSSIYLMLRYLGQVSGLEVAYAHCPADTANHSLVSICGLLLT